MIIFGWRTCESTAGSGTFTCPHCRTPQLYRHVTYRRWFTLYFLPVIPLGRVGEQLECQGCYRSFSMQALEFASEDEPFVAVLADGPAVSKPSATVRESAVPARAPATEKCPGARAGSQWEAAKTSSLAISSLVLGLLSPLLLCACDLSLLSSLAAIITGHLALREIHRGRGRVEGSGMAVSGLVLGYLLLTLSVALLVILFDRFQRNERDDLRASFAAHEDAGTAPDSGPAASLETSLETIVRRETTAPATAGDLPRGEDAQPGGPIRPPGAPTPAESVPRPAFPSTRPLPDTAPAVNELEIELVHRFPDIGWQIKSLAFANHATWLAAGKLDETLVMFDVESRAVTGSMSKLTELRQVDRLAFAADDTHLFAGGSSGAIQAWSVDPSGQLGPARSLSPHTRAVQVLAPSAASAFVLSGSADGTLAWQTYGRDANRFNTRKAFERNVLAAWLPTDGFEAVATDGRQVSRFDLRSAEETQSILLSRSVAHAAAFSADGTRLAVSSLSEIRIWDTAGRELQTLARETGEMHWTVRFHPNGRWLVSGGRGRAWIWDLDSGRCLATVGLDCPFYIQVLAISGDGTLLALAPSAAGQSLTVVRLPAAS